MIYGETWRISDIFFYPSVPLPFSPWRNRRCRRGNALERKREKNSFLGFMPSRSLFPWVASKSGFEKRLFKRLFEKSPGNRLLDSPLYINKCPKRHQKSSPRGITATGNLRCWTAYLKKCRLFIAPFPHRDSFLPPERKSYHIQSQSVNLDQVPPWKTFQRPISSLLLPFLARGDSFLFQEIRVSGVHSGGVGVAFIFGWRGKGEIGRREQKGHSLFMGRRRVKLQHMCAEWWVLLFITPSFLASSPAVSNKCLEMLEDYEDNL